MFLLIKLKMYDSICRVCLKKSKIETMVPLMEKPGKRSPCSYNKLLVKFAKISTEYSDILPAKLCQDCGKMIGNMYFFTRMCINNDKQLKKLVKVADSDPERLKSLICSYSISRQRNPAYSRSEAKNYLPDTQGYNLANVKNRTSMIKTKNHSKGNQQNIDSLLKSIEDFIDMDCKTSKMKAETESDKILSFNSLKNEENASNLQELIGNYPLSTPQFSTFSSLAVNSPETLSGHNRMLTCTPDTQETDIDHENDDNRDPSNSHNLSTDPSSSKHDEIDSLLNSIEQVIKNYNSSPKRKSDVDGILDSVENALNSKIRYCTVRTQLKDRSSRKMRNTINQPNTKSKTVKRNLECKICSKILANPATFKYHMQMHADYKYICDQCGKAYPGKDSLNNHLVTKHGKGAFVQCDQCMFKCPRRFELIEHMRIHTGERPFACEPCGLTFRRRAIWKVHLRHHQKTVPCKLCDKKFATPSQVQSHLNSSHERKYLYVCHICNVTFAKNGTVRKHLTVKHGIPREKQGKIMRVSKESNSFLFNEQK